MKRILAALSATLIATPAFAGGLNLTIDGVRNTKGSVIVLVFDSERAYNQLDWQKVVQYADIPARSGRVTHRFSDLTGGPYAVLVFHDENGDQNLNFKGEQPLEGIGASGVTQSTPYPNFAQAAVRPGNVALRLYYDR